MSTQEQLDDIKGQLAKQAKLLAKTAQQVLSLQVSSTRKDLNQIPDPIPNSDNTDYATNEDLVQLVGELQGQLNLLEQKSSSRTANAHLSNDTDEIIILPNLDGDLPDKEIFPKTIADFAAISDDTIIFLCSFYQLLPPTLEERAAMQAFIEGKVKSPNVEFKPSADEYPPETIDTLYKELSIFLGLSHIKRDS
ncbi:Mrp8 protein [Pichia kluyveri]|uniref:Mrp8 protein n=1 Tax=Pichia kluyveri TaxID=36015 RepID=A0AAV5R5P1_PICKL|nr:Mrp8 protein [Pichia kluyveri]